MEDVLGSYLLGLAVVAIVMVIGIMISYIAEGKFFTKDLIFQIFFVLFCYGLGSLVHFVWRVYGQ